MADVADSNKTPLKKGDQVWVKCLVKEVFPNNERNNVTLEVVGKKDDPVKALFAATSHQVTKVEEKKDQK